MAPDDAPIDPDVDDAFRAVLEGLRTTMPGVMVLFAFLLTIPFQTSFSRLSNDEQTAYYLAFFGSAIAAVLLIAPSAHQRLRALQTGVRRHSRKHLRFTVRMTVAGTVAFSIALGSAVYLVTSVVVEQRAAAVGTAVVAVLLGWAWFYVPLVSFNRS
jgi:Family of unknown function (DUF6328)